MADFGTDISAVDDLDRDFTLVSGETTLAQALARRLQTPRGGLFYDPDYGYDVRELLLESLTAARISQAQAAISAECVKDERVVTATAAITFNAAEESLTIEVEIETADGTFDLVLSVDNVTVELLSPE